MIRINSTTGGTELVGNSDFTFEKRIYSGYINYAKTMKKFGLQIGARFENFQVDGLFNRYEDNSFNTLSQTETIDQDLFNIFPSAFFTYNPTEKNQWQLNCKRIDRH